MEKTWDMSPASRKMFMDMTCACVFVRGGGCLRACFVALWGLGGTDEGKETNRTGKNAGDGDGGGDADAVARVCLCVHVGGWVGGWCRDEGTGTRRLCMRPSDGPPIKTRPLASHPSTPTGPGTPRGDRRSLAVPVAVVRAARGVGYGVRGGGSAGKEKGALVARLLHEAKKPASGDWCGKMGLRWISPTNSPHHPTHRGHAGRAPLSWRRRMKKLDGAPQGKAAGSKEDASTPPPPNDVPSASSSAPSEEQPTPPSAPPAPRATKPASWTAAQPGVSAPEEQPTPTPPPPVRATKPASWTDDPRLLCAALEGFYKAHNPANLDKINGFLARYQGREAQLVADVEAKYKDKGVRLVDYLPSPSSSRGSSSVDMAALPGLLLSVFAKDKDKDEKQPRRGSFPSSSSSFSTPPRTVDETSTTASPSDAEVLSKLVAEKAHLGQLLKTTQTKLEVQARKAEALQRNLVNVMEKEHSLHTQAKEATARLALLEASAKRLEEEARAARAGEAAATRTMTAAVEMQHLLQAQVQSLTEELSVFLSPFDTQEDASSPEASAPPPAESSSAAPTPNQQRTTDESVLETCLKASRLELAAAYRARNELEEACFALKEAKDQATSRLVGLEEAHRVCLGEVGEMREGLGRAEEEFGRQAHRMEELEGALAMEREKAAGLETQLQDAQEAIEAADRARRELETFAHQFRKGVERAADARINQVLTQAKETVEELLAKQASVQAAQEEAAAVRSKEEEEEKGRLTQALVESRHQAARWEKEVGRLKEEIVRLGGGKEQEKVGVGRSGDV